MTPDIVFELLDVSSSFDHFCGLKEGARRERRQRDTERFVSMEKTALLWAERTLSLGDGNISCCLSPYFLGLVPFLRNQGPRDEGDAKLLLKIPRWDDLFPQL